MSNHLLFSFISSNFNFYFCRKSPIRLVGDFFIKKCFGIKIIITFVSQIKVIIMEFKGTKGKWILEWGGSNASQDMLQIINEKGEEVCNFGDSTTYYPTEGKEPNKYDALLISKSPEMLEMLERVLTAKFTCEEIKQLIKEATEI